MSERDRLEVPADEPENAADDPALPAEQTDDEAVAEADDAASQAEADDEGEATPEAADSPPPPTRQRRTAYKEAVKPAVISAVH